MEPTSPGHDRPAAARPRIGVVRNPRSHRNRGLAQRDGDEPGLLVTAPASRAELSQVLARFAAQGVELLVVDGGDGTMREVLSAGVSVFGDAWPSLLVLPKGKTNALAIDLGMPAKWSLDEALAAAPRMRSAVRRPILLERQDADGRAVMGFIMGTGVFDAAIAAGQVAHRFGAFQGFAVAVTALFGVLQALFGIGRSRWRALSGMRLTDSGGHDRVQSRHGAPRRHFGGGFSTLGKFPLGMNPFAGAGPGIRYLIVDAPLRRVMALMPAVLMGLDRPFLQQLGVHRGAGHAFTIELDGSFILDGEAFPPGRYALRPGPELRFLVP